MKKYAYILGFASAITMTLLVSGSKMGEKERVVQEQFEEMTLLSSRINIVNFVSNDEVVDGFIDDEAIIIYPQIPVKKSDSNHFAVEEFIKYDKKATKNTKHKITTLHIPQLERVRDNIKKPIIIRSAARSKEWELSKGRSGKSQHVYKSGFGAVDVSISDYNTDTLNE